MMASDEPVCTTVHIIFLCCFSKAHTNAVSFVPRSERKGRNRGRALSSNDLAATGV